MADYKKYKVGITVKESWASDISYEALDMVLYAVDDGGDGCSYTALKDNIGVVPGTDPTTWVKSTQAGQSIYDLAVKYKHFVGTEEEFEAQYQQVLQDARDAAAGASGVEAQVEAAEALRVAAEQERERVSAADHLQAVADSGRASDDHAQAVLDSGRASDDHTLAASDHETAAGDHTTAGNDHTQATTDHGNYVDDRAATQAVIQDANTAIGQADDAAAAALAAAAKGPKIENGTWWVWNSTLGEYVDTEVNSTGDDGITPHIDSTTGNWFLGSTDTGVHAQGEQGEQGPQGVTPHIDPTTGNWFIGNTDTGVHAKGDKGDEPVLTAGADGTIYSDGVVLTEVIKDAKEQADADHTRAEADHESIADKANVDGYYPQMGVGTAQRLEGDEVVEGSFFERTAGADAEIANGLAQMLEAQGKSQPWNQNVKNDLVLGSEQGQWRARDTGTTVTVEDGALKILKTSGYGFVDQLMPPGTIINGHTYYIAALFKTTDTSGQVNIVGYGVDVAVNDRTTTMGDWKKIERIRRCNANVSAANQVCRIADYRNENNDTFYVKHFSFIDLTLLGIDSFTTVAQVEAWLAQFPSLAPYYPYNAGAVLNNSMEGIETIGQNLLDPATGKARIIGAYSDVYGNYYGITGTHGTLTFTDDLGNESTITPDSDGKFLLEVPGWLDVASAGSDCAVFLWWDGTKTDFVEYQDNKAYLDVKHIWGKLNGAGDLVQVWPTGMPGIGDIKDSLKIENGEVVAERKIGEVDLGGLNWTKNTTSAIAPYFAAYPTGMKAGVGSDVANILCSKYNTVARLSAGSKDKVVFADTDSSVEVKDSAYSDEVTFKTAMNGVMLYYERTTARRYTDLVYKDSPYFPDGTPVTLPVNYSVDNWGIERVIPQNSSEAVVTTPPELKCKYAVDIVEDNKTIHDEIDELDGRKADKQGDFPLMSVGSAKNLSAYNSIHSELTFDKVPTGAATGLAQLQKLLGKSLVWNQIIPLRTATSTIQDVTYTPNGDGSYTVNGTASANSNYELLDNAQNILIAGHKYLFKISGNTATRVRDSYSGSSSNINFTTSQIYTCPTLDVRVRICISVFKNEQASNEKVYVQVIDLTLMFGSGSEPSTVAEFEALYPLLYYVNNAGAIKNNETQAIESVEENQWDEEWESGKLDTNGATVSDATCIRSKNYIPVFPSTAYCIFIPSSYGTASRLAVYDADKNFIPGVNVGWYGVGGGSTIITLPANARFVRFFVKDTTYHNDICINLSSANFNGTYKPYKKHTLTLGLNSFDVTDGTNVITVNGLKQAGSVCDEIDLVRQKYIKRVGTVDLGTLTWTRTEVLVGGIWGFECALSGKAYGGSNLICAKYPTAVSGHGWGANMVDKTIVGYTYDNSVHIRDDAYSDAATFKAAMSGVMLNYELATPVEYDLVKPIGQNILVNALGTLRRLPEDTASAVLAPLSMDVKYSLAAVKILQNLPVDYTSIPSLDALLTTLGTALNGTFTRSWSAESNKYVFTFTPNA